MTKIRIILWSFLFAFWGLLPNKLDVPVKSREIHGVVLDTQQKEIDCAVSALWYEARGESEAGIKAVMQVILNRKYSRDFPGSICKVVHQPKQFSYMNNIKPGVALKPQPKNSHDTEVLLRIQSIAHAAVHSRMQQNLPREALYYTRVEIKRSWMKNMKVVAVEGEHKFLAENNKGI